MFLFKLDGLFGSTVRITLEIGMIWRFLIIVFAKHSTMKRSFLQGTVLE